MTYEEIHTSVETLVKKYEERDPFKLCRATIFSTNKISIIVTTNIQIKITRIPITIKPFTLKPVR